MSTTPSRGTRLLAGLGAAAVTVGIIVAATLGYNAWQSDDASESVPTIEPSTSPSPEPSDSPRTEQASPESPETGSGDSGSVHPRASKADEPKSDPTAGTEQGKKDKHDKRESEDTGPPEWKTVLDGFAHDFKKVTGTKKQWLAKMARWVTPYLAEAYKTTDPRMLPNTSIDRIEIQSQSSTAVTAIIHYHGIQPVWVVLRPTPDGWRVTQAEPYEGD